MGSLMRSIMTMHSHERIEAYVDKELRKLSNNGKAINKRFQDFIDTMLSLVLHGDKGNAISMLKEQMMLTVKNWEKKLEEKEEELHGYVKDYAYFLLAEGVFRAVDKKPIKKLADKIDSFFSRFDDRDFSTYHTNGIAELITRIEFFGKQIIEFKFWDTQYNINMFAETLMMTGKHIIDHGHFAGHVKTGRKCMAAGGMLKKAYEYNMDTTLSNLYEGAKSSFTPREDNPRLSTWNFAFKSNHPERVNKMIDVANKRSWKWEANRFQCAWNNITKIVGKSPFKYPIINQWAD